MNAREILHRWHERRRLWLVLALLAALLIVVGSLTPGSEMPQRLPWDKFNHFVGYGGLATLVSLAGMRELRAFALVVAFGIAIEYAQIPVPGRSGGDGWDILANTLGAASALLVLARLRQWLVAAS
ncbi:VanZ family protein [Halomonas sp. ML-15]|uniref:VanZ family protein n=1 Tax=Halomonas sp. ML-15 TaxID=2773305 RepID=UPI00174666A6|nr:VanZ family protein [Halomonas sp. ML-15]MBD3895363.1 VanZ family protein [Halomonas sp. ML-15]